MNTTTVQTRDGILPRGFLALLVSSYGALMMAAVTLISVTLALRIQQIAPTRKEAVLSVALSLGNVMAAVANPLVGHLSEHTASRWGMRRPWLRGGALVGLLGTLLIASVTSTTLAVTGWCLAQVGFHASFAALSGVMTDQIVPESRSRIFGFIGTSQSLGILAGAWIAKMTSHWLLFALTIPPLIAPAVVILLVPAAAGPAAAA